MAKSFRRISRLLCVLFLMQFVSPASAPASTLLGIYYGNQGWKMEQVQAMENWQGKKHAVVNMFTNWCNQKKSMDNLFNQQLVNIWNNKNVPMITWEPFLCKPTTTPADVEVRAANGEYDAYFNNWADRLKVFLSGPDGIYGTSDDRRAYLRLGHEMNGDWYPWGAKIGNNSPNDYKQMWQRVVGIFSSRGMFATHLQWVWAANHEDVGGFTAEQFYPGDAYVDWIAVDGYNWGESQSWSDWKNPEEVYGNMISRLRLISARPLALTETGCSTSTLSGAGVSAKQQWTADFFNYLAAQNIKLVAWFNEDKETDWAVFGGGSGDGVFNVGRTKYKTYSAYRNGIGSPAVIASDANNPRLLTDAQFAGQ